MNKDTFSRMVTAHSSTLYRVARTMLASEDDCRDALGEAVLRAWESRGRLRDETRFSPWITRILINVCKSMHRRQRRIVLTESIPEHAAPPDIRQSPVFDALCALPEPLRLPAVLHYVEGYSVEETADILRLPGSTVRGRLARARAALRLELTEEGEKP